MVILVKNDLGEIIWENIIEYHYIFVHDFISKVIIFFSSQVFKDFRID